MSSDPHNRSPWKPIQEAGTIFGGSEQERRQTLYLKSIALSLALLVDESRRLGPVESG